MHTPWLYDKDSYTCPINPTINDQDDHSQSFSLMKLICTTLQYSLTSEQLSILYENFKILRIDG